MQMRLGLHSTLFAACLLAAACNTVETSDPRPGGQVWTEDKSISWLSDTSGNPAGHKNWIFVRVIAPAGATECRVEASMFDGVNPFPKTPVDDKGAAMVTVRDEKDKSSIACRTPEGWVKRTLASERIVNTFKDYTGKKTYQRGYWAVPPMIHIDPKDLQAAARWDALAAEICPVVTRNPPFPVNACRDDRLERMKARDISG